MEKELEHMKLVLFGDGNGNKGLIRRTDSLENHISVLRRQSWAIIVLLGSLWMERILTSLTAMK